MKAIHAIIFLATVVLFGCKKDEDITPNKISFAVVSFIDGEYKSEGLKNVRYSVYELYTKKFIGNFYSDTTGAINLSLDKDNEYYFYVNTPTYENNGEIYSYVKKVKFLSSMSTKKGYSKFIQKDMSVLLSNEDKVDGMGYNNTEYPIPDPSK